MDENKGRENLIPFHERTEEEQREIRRMGGVASGEARRKKADMKKLLELALEKKAPNSDLTYAESITMSILSIANDPRKGGASVKAFERILRTIGQEIPEPEYGVDDPLNKLLGDLDEQSRTDA